MTVLCREELPPFFIMYHIFYNSWNKFLILFFRILFIEDAVFCISESDTPETVMNISYTKCRVVEIRYIFPRRMSEITRTTGLTNYDRLV